MALLSPTRAIASAFGKLAIVDLDNGFRDIAGMLDVRPERTLFDMVRDLDMLERDDIERYVVKHEITDLDVLAGPTVLEWRKISPDQVRHVIEFLARNYDTVILDTSGMLNELAEMAVEVATIVLWITTTEYASVKDSLEAMQALKMLSYSQERVRIVMNAISPDDGVRPSVVQDALQRDVFWNIPYDKKVRQGTHLGQPIVITAPGSVAAKNFGDLATLIANAKIDGAPITEDAVVDGLDALEQRRRQLDGRQLARAEALAQVADAGVVQLVTGHGPHLRSRRMSSPARRSGSRASPPGAAEPARPPGGGAPSRAGPRAASGSPPARASSPRPASRRSCPASRSLEVPARYRVARTAASAAPHSARLISQRYARWGTEPLTGSIAALPMIRLKLAPSGPNGS